MDLDSVPNAGVKFPCRIGVVISQEARDKLDWLKNVKGKDTSTLVRMLIDEFLGSIPTAEAPTGEVHLQTATTP